MHRGWLIRDPHAGARRRVAGHAARRPGGAPAPRLPANGRGKRPTAGAGAAPDPEGTETGHIGLEFLSRRGEGLRAWYRGPAAAQITERDTPDENGHLPFAHTSDQLRRVVPDGREDLSLAGAFEIGRLLALSQPSVVAGLLRWRQENFGAARAAEIAALALADTPITLPPETKAPDLGNLITRGLVLTAAKDTAKVLAPTRPLADPGRPLKYVRGDLDEYWPMASDLTPPPSASAPTQSARRALSPR